MSNNSLPNIANEIDPADKKETIVLAIYKRAKEYVGSNDICDKNHTLKYTVIRIYLRSLLTILKNANINPNHIMQLKTILNSKILNDMEYPLHIRVWKFLVYLNELCKTDEVANLLISEWDSHVFYF